MKNLTTLGRGLTAVILLSLLTYACNSKRPSSDDGDSARTVGQGTNADSTLVTTNPKIFLNSLLVSDEVFMANQKKRFFFSFYIDETAVKLHGWVGKNIQNSYHDPADIIMTPDRKTGIFIGPGTTITNQVLEGGALKPIIDYIDSIRAKQPTFKANLRFMPVINKEGRIQYDITFESPNTGLPLGIDPPSPISTNPSPPHKSFE